MPKLVAPELAKLDAEEESLIYFVPQKSTLSKKILRERKRDDGLNLVENKDDFEDGFDLRSLMDDGRNAIFPSKAIWPWPREKKEESTYDPNWVGYDEDDFIYPMSSVRPDNYFENLKPESELDKEIDQLSLDLGEDVKNRELEFPTLPADFTEQEKIDSEKNLKGLFAAGRTAQLAQNFMKGLHDLFSSS